MRFIHFRISLLKSFFSFGLTVSYGLYDHITWVQCERDRLLSLRFLLYFFREEYHLCF